MVKSVSYNDQERTAGEHGPLPALPKEQDTNSWKKLMVIPAKSPNHVFGSGTGPGECFVLRRYTTLSRQSSDLLGSKAQHTFSCRSCAKKIRYSPKKYLKKSRVKNPSLRLRNLSQIFTFGLREDLEIDSKLYRIFLGHFRMYLERSVVREHPFSASSPRVVSRATCVIIGFRVTLSESTYQY